MDVDGTYTPLLTSTDWNAEWQALQKARRRADDASIWDEKAKTFPVKHGSQSGYVERFLELAGVRPGETVLDMGCGTGALATPLAQAGCRVIACDFSQGMLDAMRADQASLGVTGVDVRLMSWADDWNAAGLGPDSVDVALASRSIATNDLQDALLRLDRVARRRACITLPCGPSPRVDTRLLEAVGLERQSGRDFLYAFNILASCGINPEVSYISSVRKDSFDSFENACAKLSDMVADSIRGIATQSDLDTVPTRMRTWLEANLVQDESGFHLADDRIITWAFLAWETRK